MTNPFTRYPAIIPLCSILGVPAFCYWGVLGFPFFGLTFASLKALVS